MIILKFIFLIFFVIFGFYIATSKNSNFIKIKFNTIFAHDKLLHLMGSQIICILIYSIYPNILVSCVVCLIIGIILEIAQKENFDYKDIVFNIFGIIFLLSM